MESIKNRRGSFEVSMLVIDDNTTKFSPEVWKNFLIVDARANYLNGTISYSAYSPLFEEVPFGMVTPHYNIILTRKTCPKSGTETIEVSALKTDDS